MNVYELLRFPTVGSMPQYGTLQYIMSITYSLNMTQLLGKKRNNFQQLSNLIELRFISTT